MWWRTEAGESEPVSPVPIVTGQMLTEAIEQHGPQTADELALIFGITSRKVASSLAMAISKGRLIRVNQGGKFRYCIPGDNLPAEPKAALVTKNDGKKPFLSQPVLRYQYRKRQHRKILKQKLWRTLSSRCHCSPKRKRMTCFTIAAYGKS